MELANGGDGQGAAAYGAENLAGLKVRGGVCGCFLWSVWIVLRFLKIRARSRHPPWPPPGSMLSGG